MKDKFTIYTSSKTRLADTTRPVSIYLRLRDVFPNTILLESSDYHSRENSVSYVCADPVAGIILQDDVLSSYFPDGSKEVKTDFTLIDEIDAFKARFARSPNENQRYISSGLFGYFTWDTIQHFEDISFKAESAKDDSIPSMQYHVYKYIIAIDHFKNEITFFNNNFNDSENLDTERIEYIIRNKNFPEYNFNSVGEESSNLTNEDFISIVEKLKKHILRGDVFQIVPSRAFKQSFSGDEFNV